MKLLLIKCLLLQIVSGELIYENCRLIDKAYSDTNLKNLISLENMVKGQVYYLAMDGYRIGDNSIKSVPGSDMCVRLCPDGTIISFVYSGWSLVCSFKMPDYSKCESCVHYCHQTITQNKLLTSKDMCYHKNVSDTVTKLKAFWTDYMAGIVTDKMRNILNDKDIPPAIGSCLKAYIGITMPPLNGDCVTGVGDRCIGDYCVSSNGVGFGFTNQKVSSEQMGFLPDVRTKVRCRLVSNEKQEELMVCDDCIVHDLIGLEGAGLFSFAFNKSFCGEYTASISEKLLTNYNTSNAIEIIKWLTNKKHPFKGIEIPVRTATDQVNTFIKLLKHDLMLIPGKWAIDVRYITSDTAHLKSTINSLHNENWAAFIGARYVTVDVTNELYSKYLSYQDALENALSIYRMRYTVDIVAKTDKARVAVINNNKNHLSILWPPQDGGIMVGSIRRSINEKSENFTNTNATGIAGSGRQLYYYYIGKGVLTTCSYITTYMSNIILSAFPYQNTKTVPQLSVYLATDNFTCTVGTPTPATSCAATLPQVAFSVSELRLTPTNPSNVYYDQVRGCFWYPVGPQLCTFSQMSKTVTSQLYLVDGRVSSIVEELSTHYLALRGFYKVIVDLVDVVEIIPVDQICQTVDLSVIPTCIEAVCGTDMTCRRAEADGVCFMDTTVRNSIQNLINEFEYTKTRYKVTISVAEVWRQTNQLRAKRFIGAIIAGVALGVASAAFGLSAAALVKADIATARANQALDTANKALAVGMRNEMAIRFLGGQVDSLKESVGIVNDKVTQLTDSVTQLGNSLIKVSTSLQRNIDAVNARVSALETSVNERFTQVTNYINSVTTQLGTTITYQGRSAIYFQQLTALSNTIIQSTSKLISQTNMYDTCLQNIHAGRLFGCPISDPYVNENPDYMLATSVYGAVYDGAFLSVLFKVPTLVTQMAIYSVMVKPILINKAPYLVDTSDVVMGADGNFYHEPFCEGRYCLPFEPNLEFTKCFSHIVAKNEDGIESGCKMIACSKTDCSDKMKMKAINGTLHLTGVPLATINFQSPSFMQFGFDKLKINNYSSFSDIEDISDYMEEIANITDNLNKKINKSEDLFQKIMDKVNASGGLDAILNQPLENFGYLSSSTSWIVPVIIVLVIVIIIMILGAGCYIYCKMKRKGKYSYRQESENKQLIGNNMGKYQRLPQMADGF